ncbi:MAG: geranylgeranylglycerol-phosphate geranylgeranyltransferase [candidate division WOR-3 bacterium]
MGYFRIIRPVNCLITLISVFVGAWISRSIVFSGHLLAAGLIGFAVCAFGNVVNDIKDVEIDRINNPRRPLPAGEVRLTGAWIMVIFFFTISVIGAFFLGIWPFLTVITAILLLYLYSTHLKKTLGGNITVALIAGLSFVFGGLVARNPACIIPFLFSILIHLPREIVKDVMDMRGDRAIGALTLPIILGPFRACTISALLLACLCLILPLPYVLGILNRNYIVMVLVAGYPVLLYIVWRLLRKPPTKNLPLISNLIKTSMAIGLIAMIVS